MVAVEPVELMEAVEAVRLGVWAEVWQELMEAERMEVRMVVEVPWEEPGVEASKASTASASMRRRQAR